MLHLQKKLLLKYCVQCIFEKGEAHCVRGKLKEIWTTNLSEQKEQFQKDQARNGRRLGPYSIYTYVLNSSFLYLCVYRHGNQWSRVTIRMGKA